MKAFALFHFGFVSENVSTKVKITFYFKRGVPLPFALKVIPKFTHRFLHCEPVYVIILVNTRETRRRNHFNDESSYRYFFLHT